MKKKSKESKFICEICGCETPLRYEGDAPNVCADCVPLEKDKIREVGYGDIERY